MCHRKVIVKVILHPVLDWYPQFYKSTIFELFVDMQKLTIQKTTSRPIDFLIWGDLTSVTFVLYAPAKWSDFVIGWWAKRMCFCSPSPSGFVSSEWPRPHEAVIILEITIGPLTWLCCKSISLSMNMVLLNFKTK